ncbi:MAG: ABC transporter permease [Propionibacteriaceae bacterium]|nr:ABC transporter permease [Propionibacteriaceae bacterium]
MRALAMNTVVESKLFYRTFVNVFFIIAFPLMMLFLFGEIFGNDGSAMFGGTGAVDASVPGYVVMVICVTGLMTTPITLCTYRERRILRMFRATPLGAPKVVLTQLAVNAGMTIIGIAVLMATAHIAYTTHMQGSWLELIVGGLLALMCVYSIGFLIAALSPSARTATVIANIVYFPTIFLSGATIPLEVLPDSLRKFADWIPITHAVKVLKSVFAGDHFWANGSSLIVVLATTVVAGVIAMRFFRWGNS